VRETKYIKGRRHRQELVLQCAALFAALLLGLLSVGCSSAPRPVDKTVSVKLKEPLSSSLGRSILKRAKKQDIYLGDWYRTVIAPKDVNLASVYYEQNMCPKAERYAALTVNLPNHAGITLEDAKRVANIITQIREN